MPMDPSMMGGAPADPTAGMPVMLNMDDLRAILAEAGGKGGEGESARVSNRELMDKVEALEQGMGMLMEALQLAPPGAAPAGPMPGPQDLAAAAPPMGEPPMMDPGMMPKAAGARNHLAKQLRKLRGVR
jgi:hypothetical protein